jgi:aspartyl-tRNA(Asn)/glutamyl-tRNA(Gln) amidotransferase subunit C
MTDKVGIAALAKLSRLEVSEAELKKLEKEIPAILHFVETIQKADVSGVQEGKSLHNVMRADEDPIEPGTYTEKLLAAAPARDGDRIAVKQVISRKRTANSEQRTENP